MDNSLTRLMAFASLLEVLFSVVQAAVQLAGMPASLLAQLEGGAFAQAPRSAPLGCPGQKKAAESWGLGCGEQLPTRNASLAQSEVFKSEVSARCWETSRPAVWHLWTGDAAAKK